MKKFVSFLLILTILLNLTGCKEKVLPLPEISDGLRGDLGIDKNINEETIDDYLNRKDSVYRDMRMLIDDADYEAIDGDSYLSGFVKGFEVVPFPYICNVDDLPEEVGSTYTGTTLFSHVDDDYIQNYAESLDILKELFPQDKNIFLMCGGGGYAGMMKELLVYLGWDENKIYNVGGYWYYNGKNKVEVKSEIDGKVSYDFDLVNYHDIDFDRLTLINFYNENKNLEENVNESGFTIIESVEELNNLENNIKTFTLFVYLPGCSTCKSFFPIVKEFAVKNNVKVYAVELDNLWKVKNSVTNSVSYAPSMMIYKDGKLIAYLDSALDSDYDYYKSVDNLYDWFEQYIDISEFETKIFE